MTDDSKVRAGLRLREDDVAFSSLSEDEGALLNLDRRELYILNATARLIIEAIESGVDEDAIVRRVTTEFEVDEGDCRADVEEFLKRLAAAGLIER